MQIPRVAVATAAILFSHFNSLPSQAQTSGSWNVNAGGSWGTAANWLNSAIPNGAGATAIFDFDINGNRSVDLDGARSIGNLEFSDITHSYTLSSTGGFTLTLDATGDADSISNILVGERQTVTVSAQLAGSGTIQKDGAGTLILSNAANTLAGPLTVNAGRLVLPTTFSEAGSSLIHINSGGALSLGFTTEQATWSSRVSAASQGAVAFSTAVSGLDLSAHAGVRIGSNSATGFTQNDLTLDSADTSYAFGGGGGILTIGANLANGSAARTLDVSSPFHTQGSQGATTAPASHTTVHLSGTNAFTGATTIGDGGILVWESASAMGSATGRSITITNTGVAAVAFNATQAQSLSRIVASSTGTYAIATDVTENYNLSGFANLRFGAVGTRSYSGTLSSNNTLRFGGSGSLTLTQTLPANVVTIDFDIERLQVNDEAYAQSAMLRLTGDNSAVLTAGKNINIGTSATATGATATFQVGAQAEVGTANLNLQNDSARLELLDGVSLSNTITFANNGTNKQIVLNSGSATLTGTINGNDNTNLESEFNVASGATLTVSGKVTGTGGNSGSFEVLGGGTVIFSNPANDAAEATGNRVLGITSGTVVIATTGADFGSLIQLRDNTATLSLLDGVELARPVNFISTNQGDVRSVSLGTGQSRATISGGIALNDSSATDANISVAEAHAVLTVSSDLTGTGTGGFQKQGLGTVLLTGANNSYVGTTTISAGTVRIAAGSSLGSTSGIILNGTTATLELGDGVTVAAPLTVNNAGGSSANKVLAVSANANVTYEGGITMNSRPGNGLFTVNVGEGGTLTVKGAITTTLTSGGTNWNSSALSKRGTGTLILTAANTYIIDGTTTAASAATALHAGTLRLDYSANNAPLSNILPENSSTTNLSGGTLEILGKADTANTQTFANGTTFGAGSSSVHLSPGVNGTVTLSLGAITRSALGATVDFLIPASGATISTSFTPTRALLTNNRLTAYATVNGSDWAAVDQGKIIGGSSLSGFYTPSSNATWANLNIDVVASRSVPSGGANTRNSDSLRFHQSGSFTLTNATAGNLLVAGGILVTANVGANESAIAGPGTLTGRANGGASDLVIHQHNTQGDLVISAPISNNGATSVGLTKTGAGRLVLSNTANTFTSGVQIVGGSLAVPSNGSLGAQTTAANATVHLDGGTLEATSSFTLSDGTLHRDLSLGDYGGTLKVTADNTLTVPGTISNPANTVSGLTKSGAGTLILTGTNSYTGATIVHEGILQIGTGGGNLANTGANVVTAQITVRGGATLTGSGSISGAVTSSHRIESGAFLKPGDSSLSTGDGRAVLSFAGDLKLAGGSTTVFNLGSPTGSAASLIGAGDWVASIAEQLPSLLSGAVIHGLHDQLRISGTLTLETGTSWQIDASDYTAVEGDVFNLIDWAKLVTSGFNVGTRYQSGSELGLDLDLPSLGDGYLWDTSLFLTHGALVVVAVPEPGRVLLLLLAGAAVLLRRRRRFNKEKQPLAS